MGSFVVSQGIRERFEPPERPGVVSLHRHALRRIVVIPVALVVAIVACGGSSRPVDLSQPQVQQAHHETAGKGSPRILEGEAWFFGGRSGDHVADLATDAQGNTYIVGSTGSKDLPTKSAAQKRYAGCNEFWCMDAFVAKVDMYGKLVYATFLGGSCGAGGGWDYATSVAVDPYGNAYVTGATSSADFPTTSQALKTTISPRDESDAFVAKLDPDGRLVFSTYLGGSVGLGAIGHNLTGDDIGEGIAVDRLGNAFVVGHTDSRDFPMQAATQPEHAGAVDAFLSKIDPSGKRLLFSTYLGGDNEDEARAVALDTNGRVVVAGTTLSTDFPTSSGAFQSTLDMKDGDNAFVAQLAVPPHGLGLARLTYSSYLGGGGEDTVEDIALGRNGDATVVGSTASPDFPTEKLAFQEQLAGSEDAFVAIVPLRPGGRAVSTYLGGRADDSADAVAVGDDGAIYVTGVTASADFPLRRALQGAKAGHDDMFAARLDPSSRRLDWSTYLGGPGRRSFIDVGSAISVRGKVVTVAGFARGRPLRCCRTIGKRGSRVDAVLIRLMESTEPPKLSRP